MKLSSENHNKKSNHFSDGDFYIHGDFDETISTEIMPKFNEQISKKEKLKGPSIKFYISSSGGFAYHLKDLLALIEFAKNKGVIIETYVFSHAYSCGSLLACAGTKGHRYISEFAEHLCHLGSTSSGAVINDIEADRMAARMKRHFDFVRMTYKKYAKVKNLEKLMHDDCYFLYGQEIIDNGLADKLITDKE